MKPKYIITFPPGTAGGYEGQHPFFTQKAALQFLRRATRRANSSDFTWTASDRRLSPQEVNRGQS